MLARKCLPAVFVPSYRCLKNDWGCGIASNWTLPFKQQRDLVSWGNFNAPQCVHSTLSVPTCYICSVEEVVWLIVKPPKAWVCACTYLLSACCVSLLLQSSVEWISSSLLMGSCILLLLLPPCYWVFTSKSTGSCITLLFFFSGGLVRTRKSTGSCIVDPFL